LGGDGWLAKETREQLWERTTPWSLCLQKRLGLNPKLSGERPGANGPKIGLSFSIYSIELIFHIRLLLVQFQWPEDSIELEDEFEAFEVTVPAAACMNWG
jgi:hypothetical protein